MTICNHHDCVKAARTRGLCSAHYERMRVAQSPPCTLPGCGKSQFAKGICQMHYRRMVNHRTTDSPGRTESQRFWDLVSIDGECWVFRVLKPNGYGQFRNANGSQAHRFAYEDMVGEIPAGLVIDHLCRNRACVRPDHLEPVTQSLNLKRGFLSRQQEKESA